MEFILLLNVKMPANIEFSIDSGYLLEVNRIKFKKIALHAHMEDQITKTLVLGNVSKDISTATLLTEN